MHKPHHILYTGLILLTLGMSGVHGCNQASDRTGQFTTAAGAAAHVMLLANPLAAVYGTATGTPTGIVQDGGCPAVTFTNTLAPPGTQYITVSYDADCLERGLAVSGSASGHWEFSLPKLHLDMMLSLDDVLFQDLTVSGTVHAMASIDRYGPYARLDGGITSMQADGRTCRLDFGSMTAVMHVNDELLDLFSGTTAHAFLSPYDDMLVMDGSAVFIDENHLMYDMFYEQVTQSYFCLYPVAGTITMLNEREGFAAMIDFGDGTCDGLITVTIDAEAREIDLRQWLDRAQ